MSAALNNYGFYSHFFEAIRDGAIVFYCGVVGGKDAQLADIDVLDRLLIFGFGSSIKIG